MKYYINLKLEFNDKKIITYSYPYYGDPENEEDQLAVYDKMMEENPELNQWYDDFQNIGNPDISGFVNSTDIVTYVKEREENNN